VQATPLLSRHAVPPALHVVFVVSAQPVVMPAVQLVAHAVVLPQARPLPQGTAVPPPEQVPVPLQVLKVVSMLPVQEVALHIVALDASSHTPPAAHFPSLPHGGAAVHWPDGAARPAV
jgi:hypothetical protein